MISGNLVPSVGAPVRQTFMPKRAIEIVAARPARGRVCDDIRPGYRRVSVGSHMVFYREMEAAIVIVRILHQGMDFDRHL